MVTAKVCESESVLSYLGAAGNIIARSRFHMVDICEIRLRAGRPIALETVRGRFTLDKIVSFEEIGDCVKNFCHYSVHSFEKELREGYITLKGGHRAGFCGSAVIRNNTMETIKDISGINLRISREIKGCAETLSSLVFEENFKGLLIAGKPMSGKTTVLRDLCRIIGDRHKLSVIDSRGEIAAVYEGVNQKDVGIYTDVLTGYEKKQGIEIAVRTLSPEYIACDEITGDPRISEICRDSGVKMIFTLHCGNMDNALKNAEFYRDTISHIVFLGGKLGQITEIKEV